MVLREGDRLAITKLGRLGLRQVKLARQMYEETGEDRKRKHTVADIAAEFGVTWPTIYRALGAWQSPR